MLAIWCLVPLPFTNPAWTSGNLWFMYIWSLAWRIFSINLLACEMSAIVWYFEHFWHFLFWNWNENWLFPVLLPLLSFQICWHIECNTLTASSFRVLNTAARIPSPPLALFVVMLPKAHLTSHSRISGLGEWSHHRDYLGHEDLFL